ncbi:Pentatricopeptide repeat-containing protein [Quillaja saponaria]|uniref:Pentatricopeptide repeat-containing protein n=1 Tax=Quillaja saponaria TaxID=32244 RepID=A0AAD7LLN8_QUISA|nr:Pentatricopeptide repeat-containing protein [Quillaja saponaria]
MNQPTHICRLFFWFCTSTHFHRRPFYNSRQVISASSLSLVPPKGNSLLFNAQDPVNRILSSSPLISFPEVVNQYKLSQKQLGSPSSASHISYLGSETSESLGQRYQSSFCLKDAKQLHLQIYKNGFTNDVFLCNTLINIYVRVGYLVCAHDVFDEMLQKNHVSWACLISGYMQNAMPDEACALFKEMICTGILPNQYAYGSALRACQECGPSMLKLGMQIHGLILKSQYESDAVVSNVLMSMYAEETAVSAIKLFSRMQREDMQFNFKPNEYTFGSMITAACSLLDNGLSSLEQILTRIEKSGFLQDLYVGSALVSGFAGFGLFDYAKKILDQMSERNAVSMNGLMVGLVRQSQGEEAIKVFKEMEGSVEIKINTHVILLSAFPEFSVLGEGKRKGQEVHAYLIRTALSDNRVSIGNGLVNMYAKCGAISDACSVFRLMVDKDSISWNSMISGLDQNARFEDAVNCFCEMMRNGLMPSNYSLISTLSSCASMGWINLGQVLHGQGLKLGLDLDVSVSNALLALYAENGCLSESQKIFFLMPEYDQVSWNSLIGALADSEATLLEAIRYFQDMMQAGWRLNIVTFINVLSAVSSLSLSEPGQQIHALILKYSFANETAIGNALMACYGKCGQMDDCAKIFSRMHDRVDDVSWNSMISGYIHNELLPKAMDLVWLMMRKGQRLDGFTLATVLSACASVATLERGMEVHACGYARHGHGEKALKLFTQMKHHGQSPDHVTFVGVLSACSHVGLVDKGFEHFRSMSEVYGLSPRMEHFSCMVDLLGRAGEVNKIEDFVERMPMSPNVLIWRTVLGACCRANGRNTELGRRAGKMLLELEPQNAVNYVLLSNMYASGGKWQDVAEARIAMRKAAVNKETGCSWVTMKDGVHVFVAGDKSHPEKDMIYGKLNELTRKMRDMGYVPETRFALYDLELENKEELLSYHSEKLAIAFVLTRKSDLTIRIMKNLRVCGDCHTAFKYMSKIVNRQIVLRDSNRFHHFDSGMCSCGDYW